VQHDPVHVEGSPLGAANVDIDHVIHVVAPDQRLDALINLLLAKPDDQTLVFVRTRADATHVANELVMCGFAASALSGEMDQTARNRTLATFKQGGLRVLVATDVAARGIDAQNVSCVVHAELPTDPDAYTHRSGRTGRAGRKGTSAMLVAPIGVVRATRLLRQLGVQHRVEPVPTPEQIDRQTDERLLAELTEAAAADGGEVEPDTDAGLARWRSLAQRLIAAGDVERSLTLLLARSRANVTRPRAVRVFAERAAPPDKQRGRDDRRRERRDGPGRGRDERSERGNFGREQAAFGVLDTRPERAPHPRGRDERPDRAGSEREQAAYADERKRPRAAREPASDDQRFVPFRVTWGREQGADPRRMLAMVCRRGKIRGQDVGAIRIEASSAMVEVAEDMAAVFEREAGRRDPGEPNVIISRQRGSEAAPEARRPYQPARKHAPARSAAAGSKPVRRKSARS
jgi:ATP-dependent RNA helicase DeaD